MIIICFYDNEGEPWSAHVEGRIDIAEFTAAVEADPEAREMMHDFRCYKIVHTYMVDMGESPDDEFSWHWCEADTPKAVAVTAVRW